MMAPMQDGRVEAQSLPSRPLEPRPAYAGAPRGALSWLQETLDVAVADVAFGAFLVLVTIMRGSVAAPLPLPTGADGGNWLALGGAMGRGMPGPGGVVYPPLVPAIAL